MSDVFFRHRVTGEVRRMNPYDVEANRALKAERHPSGSAAWVQVPTPPPEPAE